MNQLPLPTRLIVRHFTYLRTKAWSWSTENEHGGSFSNSGFHNSKPIAIRHFRAMFGAHRTSNVPMITYEIDANGNEELVSMGVLQ